MGPSGQRFPLKRTVGTVRQLGRVLRIFGDQGVERSKGTEPAMSSSLRLFRVICGQEKVSKKVIS